MSCSPGSPCYNNDTNCTGDPCNSSNAISCETVFYNGPTLPTTGIDSCTNICVALQEIDNTISEIITGSTTTASNGLTKVGDDIRLGGALTQTTVISTGPYDLVLTGIDTGASTDDLLVLTPGGVVKKVAASSLAPTITLTPNTGLEWTDAPTNTQLQTLYNTLIPDSAISVPVGGAPSHPALYWKTKTFVEVFNEILFPEQLPTYTIPTVQITGITGGTYEVGVAILLNATVTANKWDAGAFTTLRMLKTVNGVALSPTILSPITITPGGPFGTEFTFADPNSINIQYSGTYTDLTFKIPAPASGSSSTVIFQANGDHAAGLPKKTSLDNTDSRTAACDTTTAPQASCTTSSSAITLTGIYPIFYGVIDNPSGSATVDNASIAADIQSNGSAGRTSTKLPLTLASGTITIPFPANLNQKTFWIAVPATGNVPKTKFKPLWYPIENTFGPAASAAWNIYGTVNVTSPTSLWSGVSYTIYRSNYPTGTGTPGDFQIY
jgi:hypothetical protein